MRKLLSALTAVAFLLPLWDGEALAQSVVVIAGTTCPSVPIMQIGPNQPLVETQSGLLCTNATGGSSGGTVTQGAGLSNPNYWTVDAYPGGALLNALNAPIPACSTSPCTVTIGRTNIDQTVPGNTNAVQPIAGTTGGATPYHLPGGTAASTNSTLVSTGAHTLYSLSAINTGSTIGYVRLYDSATAPTCSSATGAVGGFPVPQNNNNGAGFALPIGPNGISFVNGIAFCVTGGGSDTDNTNAPTGIYINGGYK